MTRFLLVVVAALTIAACEDPPLPLATTADNATGKQFLAPPSDGAALYVYRARSGGLMTITVGQRTVGNLQGGNWLRVDLPAGTHDVRCAVPEMGAVSSELLDLRPGSTVYLSATVQLFVGCHLTQQPATTAQPAILAGKRVRELR